MMEERAVRERWYSTDEQRQKALGRIMALLDHDNERVVINAARAFIAMDQQTLAWAEHELKKSASTSDTDLVAIARAMGAKLRGDGNGLAGAGPLPVPG